MINKPVYIAKYSSVLLKTTEKRNSWHDCLAQNRRLVSSFLIDPSQTPHYVFWSEFIILLKLTKKKRKKTLVDFNLIFPYLILQLWVTYFLFDTLPLSLMDFFLFHSPLFLSLFLFDEYICSVLSKEEISIKNNSLIGFAKGNQLFNRPQLNICSKLQIIISAFSLDVRNKVVKVELSKPIFQFLIILIV